MKKVSRLFLESFLVTSFVFSPDGEYLAFGSYNMTMGLCKFLIKDFLMLIFGFLYFFVYIFLINEWLHLNINRFYYILGDLNTFLSRLF